ncbi:polyprenyl synthetase family protein [Actinomadura madurae]|uniref:polyprenyl synthetase family protein n=1 Tax=Actinomadura madurae TaxID=1993 RepID=UPI0027E35758|nr:polyprenyl synthetase family protein [Actinomadura madurae]
MPAWREDPAVVRCGHRPGPDHRPRTAAEVLARTRRMVDPALRRAAEAMPDATGRIAAFHFGWRDERGRPATGAGGGKAIRPAFTLLAAEAAGGTAPAALPAAVAVELAHNFSLLHDDVMDGDRTRRHRPTAWTVFGANAAILAGDGMLAAAFERLADERSAGVAVGVGVLGRAVVELVEGQSADLAFERRSDVTLDECLAMAGRKTGALLGAACALGAVSAGAGRRPDRPAARLRRAPRPRVPARGRPARHLGRAGRSPARRPRRTCARARSRFPSSRPSPPPPPRGEELAGLYLRDEPLTGEEAARAAELVEAAGARAWAAARAEALLGEALDELAAAAPAQPAAAELRALARFVTRRDH